MIKNGADPKLDAAVAQLLGGNPHTVAQAVFPQLIAHAKGNGDTAVKALQLLVAEIMSHPGANVERFLADTQRMIDEAAAKRLGTSPIVVVGGRE